MLSLLSLALAMPIVLEFLRTGLVPRLPTAVLSVGIMLVAVLSMACGLILDTVTHSRRELKRLAYLEGRAPRWPAGMSRQGGASEMAAGRGMYAPRAGNDPNNGACACCPPRSRDRPGR